MTADKLDRSDLSAMTFVREATVAMCNTGVPTSYVTDRMQAVSAAFGVDVTILALPTGVFIQHPDGTMNIALAQGTVAGSNSFRLDQLADLQHLLDDVTGGRCDAADALDRLHAISTTQPRYRLAAVLVGHALFGVGFGLLLEPTLLAIPVYAVMSAVIGVLGILVSSRRMAAAVFPAIAAFLVGVVMNLVAPHVGESATPAIVPPLVSLLPVAAMTFAVLDLSTGDAIAGTSRIAVAIQRLLLMAFGAYAASTLVPATAPISHHMSLVWGPWLGVAVFSVGCLLTQSASLRTLPYLMLIAYVTFATQYVTTQWAGPIIGGFSAGAASVLASMSLRRLPKAPPFYAGFAPVLWLIVPGAVGLQGAVNFGQNGGAAAAGQIGLTGMILVAIAAGILVVTACRSLVPQHSPLSSENP
ncbi:threonine/serine ThrE exporter family protein [Nocardia mangyaensis]|uniref:threonine/serine ThrE exporter family protein n=1 Tax=Nocardia mangyaensis TaxID=2213200 RepID=UPI002676E37C|nr:threonine/serine exporter family protein [Nocardia mangyaensis]MDO3646586.1 threonine/serine exporter family protein [Nocardia mangyaensis]